MKWKRYKLDSIEDAEKLRNLINFQWKYRSRYIDREKNILIVPQGVSQEDVVSLATTLGLVLIES